jgi:hypothetical protein
VGKVWGDETFQARQKEFYRALAGEDELGVVIRAHIYIEHELTEFIRGRVTPAQVVDSLSLTYEQRLALALATGLPKPLKAALTLLGTLRNKFAHRLEMSLNETEARQFYAAFDPVAKRVAQDSYAKIQKRPAGRTRPEQMSDLSPKNRCILYFVVLWGAVAAENLKRHHRL